ncbi:hypothetical protein L204_102239 [Cryptococcus depauperatus]|nr:hypothetical protein L204_04736 [Cryptococcus depauperatus CBS 7855]
MYWPTSTTRLVNSQYPLNDGGAPIKQARSSRKGVFFAVLTKNGLGVWDARPTVMQAAALRSKASLERFGNNIDVYWAHDGRGLMVLANTSHILFYQLVPTSHPVYDDTALTTPGPGEGDVIMGWNLRSIGVAFVMGGCEFILPQTSHLLITLRHPPSILEVPWPVPSHLVTPPGSHFPPPPLDGASEAQVECKSFDLSNAQWIRGEIPSKLYSHRTPGLPALHIMVTSKGRVFAVYRNSHLVRLLASESPKQELENGREFIEEVIHPLPVSAQNCGSTSDLQTADSKRLLDKAVEAVINLRFGFVAVGLESGKVNVISLPPWPSPPKLSHTLDLKHSGNIRVDLGRVTSMAYTGDGYCLAVGYEKGWAVWSLGGRLNGMSVMNDDEQEESNKESCIVDLFWIPGNLELFILRHFTDFTSRQPQIEVISFSKSATTNQPSPDNTRYAFLQMDDKVLVYRGADQPDMSVINPESDVWQSIKIPAAYIATNWPIRYASISPDGKLIAVAGRRGLTHYSASSGRWKLFPDEKQEQKFQVKGGMVWFHHVLVVAVDFDRTHQLRLYSRDLDLSEILCSQNLPSPILVMTLLDNSLLVYTSDNTLFHFLILPTTFSIKLHLCGSISFRGIVTVPSRVRALSWLVPEAQKAMGDPADDLIVATIIFLIDSKLVLLRPRRARTDEVRYDLQVLADRIEAYWTHLHGVSALENSLWGYDGQDMRIWLDALTIEATRVDEHLNTYETVEESVKLRLDFYPLSILMDKGIIIGVDYETLTRTLPFPIYKIPTGSHLFLPQFLRYHLSSSPPAMNDALILAQHYQSLVYFDHALEVLLHSVLEDEAPHTSTSKLDSSDMEGILPSVIVFLDHFPSSPSIIVQCARKMEIVHWPLLFSLAGKPRELFESCLKKGDVRTAASYLLVLDGLEEGGDVDDTTRLLNIALEANEFHLCEELLRFLHSIDQSGTALRTAISRVEIIPSSVLGAASTSNDGDTISSSNL